MNNWAEYVGYLASAFVVGSFLLKQIKMIRMINLLGCICFVIYGIYSGMLWPIIIPNAVLALVQIYHLIKND
ncbi:MAG: uroporphyrinogen decarboxylase [Chryseobacterium sp. 36-9]|uniref:Uroporphyrinogen decarboxylase n=1 Tax=Epilithonimonas pallida TaxID=373671 RepID=A0ABY1R381_9FLAO|nr:uroporphyrinogen decarboxylase [Epilithonimonas pallida]OJX32834.1 MAG: uroporphyrinogen decarboxylase [Chryseobacterium sp. 36-9]SMP90314.1 hypothetical protein SAMN05421679_102268 [Epilithonimonas pallida]